MRSSRRTQNVEVTNEEVQKRIIAFLLAHVFIFSLAMLRIIANTAAFFNARLQSDVTAFTQFSPWAELIGVNSKPASLIQYVLSVFGLFLLYVYFSVLRSRASDLQKNLFVLQMSGSRIRQIQYFALIIVLNVAVIVLPFHPYLLVALMPAWLTSLLAPGFLVLDGAVNRDRYGKILKWIGLALIAVLCMVIFAIFFPFVRGNVSVLNEFMDIPSTLKLGSRYVDTTRYINDHALGGLNKYDPRTDGGLSPAPRPGQVILMNRSALLEGFLKRRETQYAYDDKVRGIIVDGGMLPRDYDKLLGIAETKEERDAIIKYYLSNSESKQYLSEEIEFVKRNRTAAILEATAGHFFHHHNAMYSSINERALGRPESQIQYTYGWMNAVVLSTVSKLFGGVTFDNYLRSLYVFYPLYFALMLLASGIIFRKTIYVFLVALMGAMLIQVLGFEHIRFAPGYSPMRHVFDVFVLVFFFLYLSADRRRPLYLALAFAAAALGIFVSKEFGLILFASIGVTASIFILRTEGHQRFVHWLIVILACLVAAFVASYEFSGKAGSGTLLYTFLGVGVPGTSGNMLYGLLGFFSVVYALLLYAKGEASRPWRYLTFFWFAYAQGMLIYFVWNPAPNHLTSLWSIWALLAALALKFGMDGVGDGAEGRLLVPIATVVTLLYVPTLILFVNERNGYFSQISNYKAYTWDFPTASLRTTIDPMYFKDAVNLVQKYAPDNGIYIVSKYDNIVPILSGKYSAMPFSEVGLSLVTDKEIERCAQAIELARPTYIFVDTDIARRHIGDIYDPDDKVTSWLGVYDLSRGRAMVLDNLRRVYDDVKDHYRLVERGMLISVYERRVIK
jgi:hypothetical protein